MTQPKANSVPTRNAPLVTVIIATYKSPGTLRVTLQSVLDQTFQDFEALVVGDGCADETENAVRSFADERLHWINLPENSGSQSEPNNEGLRRARGRYIAFIGHDDLWLPQHLSNLTQFIESSGADFVHDLAVDISPRGVSNAHGPPKIGADYRHIYFPTSSWLHRAELVNDIGYWRHPDLLSWAIDFDFTRRAAQAGKRIKFFPALGVLKFHSRDWKFYSSSNPAPQTNYFSAMQKDGEKFANEILAQVAVLFSQQMQWGEKKPLRVAWPDAKLALTDMARAVFRELIDGYGTERWPLNIILRKRTRRIRSEHRIQRGLPPL